MRALIAPNSSAAPELREPCGTGCCGANALPPLPAPKAPAERPPSCWSVGRGRTWPATPGAGAGGRTAAVSPAGGAGRKALIVVAAPERPKAPRGASHASACGCSTADHVKDECGGGTTGRVGADDQMDDAADAGPAAYANGAAVDGTDGAYDEASGCRAELRNKLSGSDNAGGSFVTVDCRKRAEPTKAEA